MNEYQKMLHEIERKKEHLERRIARVVQAELDMWQQENELPIREIYIDLEDVTSMGSTKRYQVSKASVDIDFKP